MIGAGFAQLDSQSRIAFIIREATWPKGYDHVL